MIGNDIVDLYVAAKESNWRRKGFLEKVFSKEEQVIIAKAPCKHQMVWLLWSFKEAAYKAHQRNFGHVPVLNWHRQKCHLKTLSENTASGRVEIEGSDYKISSDITPEYIHTIATSAESFIFKSVVSEGSGDTAKKRLLEKVSQGYAVSPEKLTVKKTSLGIPYIQYGNQTLCTEFSLSDHGRYSAFSLSLRIS